MLAIDIGYGDRAASWAQQNNQSDVEFARERARVEAAQRRIRLLQQRVDSLERAARYPQAREHILLGRQIPSADDPGSAAPGGLRSARDSSPGARNRLRTVTTADTAELTQRLDEADATASQLGERVNRPDFGAGLKALKRDLDRIERDIRRFE
ncbi:MAG: hypothetical protein R3176_00390 [Woeseiaceae bacterium]|nr:hypothetical protein [Woeseiaceae bacterium]